MKPTKAGASTLAYMQKHGIVHASERERCLKKLAQQGYVVFSSGAGRKYGCDSWHLTDAGRAFKVDP